MTSIRAAFKTITVEPVLFLGMTAAFTEYTVVQELFFTKICMSHLDTSRVTDCNKQSLRNETFVTEISKLEALQIRYYLAISNFLAILPCLYVGSWSDHFGRLKPLCIPFIFSILASVSLIIASVLLTKDIIFLIHLSAVFNGISGGTMSLTANCFGYISDVTQETNRTKRIVVLEAMIFLGYFCGYNLAALLLEYVIGVQLYYAFLVSLLLYIVSLVYICCFLSESRETETETENGSWRALFKCDYFTTVMKTVFIERDLPQKRPKILLLIVCSMISVTSLSVQMSVLFPFLKNMGWKSSLYGYYSGFMSFINFISLVIILPLICKYLPHLFGDTIIAIFGFCSKVAGFLLLGLSNTTLLVFITPLAFMFNEFTMPSIRSMLSKIVNEDEKGKIFAFLSACQNVAQFLASLVFTSLFSITIHTFPGTCFELVATLQIIALLLILFVHFRLKENSLIEERIVSGDNESPDIGDG